MGAKRSVEASKAAQVDWRELLRRAWSETIPTDYSWTRPNRRHVWTGLYLPGVVCEGVGEICIAVDCSGSIHDRQLGLFEAEIGSILAGQQPRLVHVLYFDTEVQKCETFQAGKPVKLTPVGGGGTDFRPCFSWLADRGIQPQTMVFLTDLLGTFPEKCHPTQCFGHRPTPGKHPSVRSSPWWRKPEIGLRRPNSSVLAQPPGRSERFQ
jgi:predicted metal-dependent peptidase